MTLSVVERVGEGDPRAMYGAWYHRPKYVSSAFCEHMDCPNEATAIRSMSATMGTNTAVR